MENKIGEPARVGWNAESYHAVAAPQEGWGLELAEEFPWRGDETVLDAGCGTGRLTIKLLERIPRGYMIGVDLDPAMLEVAKKTLAGPIAEGRAEVHQGNLLEFRSPRPADLVFSNATFHWVRDHARLWKQCFSWLKPGGWLWTQCGGGGNLVPQLALIREIGARPAYADELSEFERGHYNAPAESTRALLEAAGFRNPSVSLEPRTPRFDSPESFRKFISTVILRTLEPKLGHELWERFVDDWCERHAELYGLKLDYMRLNVRAQRPLE